MRKELTIVELDAETVELLPAKETLTFDFNWTNIVANNSSLALNAASLGSLAVSSANQGISVVNG